MLMSLLPGKTQRRDPSWTMIPAEGGDEALTPSPEPCEGREAAQAQPVG